MYTLNLKDEDTLKYLQKNRQRLKDIISQSGALLCKQTGLHSIEDFEKVSAIFSQTLLTYSNQLSPRKHIKRNIYTSTEYAQEFSIPLHNENSYTSTWPNRIMFFCQTPPKTDGETPIVNSHKIYNLIPAEIKRIFETKRLKYVRHFHPNIDLDWKTVYQVNNRAQLEQYLNERQIPYHWSNNNVLKIWEILPAVLTHPVHQHKVWFNQAHLFHPAALPKEISNYLISKFGQHNLPKNVFFDDDSLIPDEIIQEINHVYEENKRCFPWEKGDILILDNLEYAHGRASFTGNRKILVAMYN